MKPLIAIALAAVLIAAAGATGISIAGDAHRLQQAEPLCGEDVCSLGPSVAGGAAPAGAVLPVAAAVRPTAPSPMWLFDTSGFPRRWDCGRWSAGLGWLHIVSDAAIWGAYMAIPVVLAFFVLTKRTPLPLITWLFIAFIASCGIGHLIEAGMFWTPLYRLSGVWKALTALASWATVIALIPIVPRAVRWPSMERVNARLQREIADRRVAEAQIRRLVESAPVGMLLVGADGRIAMANREVERTFGYSHDELLGQPVELLIPSRFREDHPGLRAGFFDRPSARRMGGGRELFGVRKDGTEVPVDVGLTPLTTSDGAMVVASIVDVSLQRRAEVELKRLNDTLQDKNSELEQFVYTASHDLKSPIVTILGYTSHVLKDLEASRTEEIRHHTERIARAAERLRTHVDDLLELSRVGRVSEAPTRIDLASFATQIWESILPPDDARRASLRLSLQVASIVMDPSHLTQLLQNLLENALRYGTGQGRGPVEFGSIAGGERVSLFVADHGPGIAPEHRERVFRLFERLSGDTEGTGVGLAIVRRVAEINSGRVRLTETPGGGATFWVDLPLAPAPQQAGTGEAGGLHAGR